MSAATSKSSSSTIRALAQQSIWMYNAHMLPARMPTATATTTTTTTTTTSAAAAAATPPAFTANRQSIAPTFPKYTGKGTGMSTGAGTTVGSSSHTNTETSHTGAGASTSAGSGSDPEIYDVCIIGGGIVGVTTAYLFTGTGTGTGTSASTTASQQHKSVVLLEGHRIGEGVTGFSTSKCTSNHHLNYVALDKMHGTATARLYGHMQQEAVAQLKQIVNSTGIECELEDRSHITYTSDSHQIALVQSEASTALACGVPARYIEACNELPASLQVKGAMEVTNQIAFNSYQYCLELAKYIAQRGVAVYEDSLVTDVKEGGEGTPYHTITIGSGSSATHLKAAHVVLATHIPILDRSMHFSMLVPSRSHCIAVQLADGVSTGSTLHHMYINADVPMRSFRSTQNDKILVVAGETVPQGQVTDTDQYYSALEAWARQHFNVSHIITKWSGMDYYASDLLPYIGRLYRGSDTIYTATAFMKWGISNGVAAAHIIRDLICGIPNQYEKMVDARRWDLVKQAGSFMQENAHTMKHFIKDWSTSITAPDISTLQPGDGGLFTAHTSSGKKHVGAYRYPNGEYVAVKPVCTHLGCHLVFNKGDHCWDCPCHGSRFDVTGSVLHGPACFPLAKEELEW